MPYDEAQSLASWARSLSLIGWMRQGKPELQPSSERTRTSTTYLKQWQYNIFILLHTSSRFSFTGGCSQNSCTNQILIASPMRLLLSAKFPVTILPLFISDTVQMLLGLFSQYSEDFESLSYYTSWVVSTHLCHLSEFESLSVQVPPPNSAYDHQGWWDDSRKSLLKSN